MIAERLSVIRLAIFLSIAVMLAAAPAFAMTQDFGGLPRGTVVAGEDTQGGSVPGNTYFPLFTLSVQNNSGGPHSIIIFDSGNPTGEDEDLRTPGPGIGNDTPLDNLLIIAEDLDDDDNDQLVDDPDDEAEGGMITFEFDVSVTLMNIVIVDIDQDETLTLTAHLHDGGQVVIAGQALGNNSVQTINFSLTPVDRLDVDFSSSGGIGEITFEAVVPTEESTWGAIKALYE